jgi:hypothetical protein
MVALRSAIVVHVSADPRPSGHFATGSDPGGHVHVSADEIGPLGVGSRTMSLVGTGTVAQIGTTSGLFGRTLEFPATSLLRCPNPPYIIVLVVGLAAMIGILRRRGRGITGVHLTRL